MDQVEELRRTSPYLLPFPSDQRTAFWDRKPRPGGFFPQRKGSRSACLFRGGGQEDVDEVSQNVLWDKLLWIHKTNKTKRETYLGSGAKKDKRTLSSLEKKGGADKRVFPGAMHCAEQCGSNDGHPTKLQLFSKTVLACWLGFIFFCWCIVLHWWSSELRHCTGNTPQGFSLPLAQDNE